MKALCVVEMLPTHAGVLDEMEAELDALGLGGLDAHVRMTGCPNGCSRPYTAEIGLVGRGKKHYDIHLGANRRDPPT